MSDDDLIRRGDALKLMQLAIDVYGQNMRGAADKKEKRDWQSMLISAVDIRYAIRALPAVQPTVKPLVWDDFAGRGAKAQAWNQANYLIQKWSDGRWEISASYPGHSNCADGIARFHPTIEAAKAAAQADYEARIRSALTAQPSPDVAALVSMTHSLIAMVQHAIGPGRDVFIEPDTGRKLSDARAALARVKGGEA